ncbi:hypothetical protein [Paenibacillus montanisoli]|uniref:Uncharacterized protein n=1 Tax=Paenibacillus montanisoli TaxID=2081970 RepID=A0A328UBN1_9BACL|nr:hypothetical protein [Paenibacillus montanisoli]RAP78305.1 hypothetical protein DL346_07715 [Paenibacillus montanisoli]
MLKGFYLTLMIGMGVPQAAPKAVVDSLLSAEVTVSSGQRSGFQLTFGLSKLSLLNTTLLPNGYFDPPTRVILTVTVNGTPHVVMDGVITRQTITPSSDPGKSTLIVIGEDLTRMMDLADLSGLPYPAMSNEARIAMILAKYAVYGIVPLIIPSVLFNVPIPTKQIPQHQGTDLEYINRLASEVGYVFYVEPGSQPGTNIAYWGPEIKFGAVQPALSINMDAQTNVDSLSFTFDGFSSTLYELLIQIPETKQTIPIPIPDVTPLNPPLGQKIPLPLRVQRIPQTAKYTPLQAAAVGLAEVAKSTDVITGSGSLDVLRYGQILKARQLVGVRGTGPTYDGLYYVTSVTHSIKQGEYKQNFSLSRNALISLQSRIPV